MKEKIEQLRRLVGEIIEQDPNVTVMMMVNHKKTEMVYISGKAIDLAATLASTMCKTPNLIDVVKGAVDAYENVPREG